MVTISQNGGTVAFEQFSGGPIQYSINYPSSQSWMDVTDFPITIENTSTDVLTVKFITDMEFTTTDHYFICGSENITFNGLKYDRDRATISFNGVESCLGLIQNGNSGTNGYSNITVKNIHVASSGTLANAVGWVCHSWFGKGSSDVLIDNCSSSGDINGQNAGGICGPSVGYDNGTVEITNCYSTGQISGDFSGGICGNYAGFSNATITISNCYSTGQISGWRQASGICGANAGFSNGTVDISNCYSLYAIGDKTIGTGGMIGSGFAIFNNTYGANGTWSSTDANSKLTGTPTDTNNPGTVWGYYDVDTHYYLTPPPYQPQDNAELRVAVNNYINSNNSNNRPDIGLWDTSLITDMSQLFYFETTFNEDVSSWNTSNVTNMSSMFRGASAFNRDIGGWDTSNVTTMANMFRGATDFKADIGGWDTSEVRDMSSMFREASAFNADIGGWNTSNVENMGSMFRRATVFNADIGFKENTNSWNTSNVTNMANMFNEATAFNQNIRFWNTYNVTNMNNMFFEATAFQVEYSDATYNDFFLNGERNTPLQTFFNKIQIRSIDYMIETGNYTLAEIVEAFPSKIISTALITSVEYALNNSYWNTIKITDSISKKKTLTNNTNNKIKIISTNRAKLTN